MAKKVDTTVSNEASTSTLAKLIETLNSGSLAPKTLTEDEMREKATRRYTSAYDEKRLSANQAYDTQALALDRQLGELNANYDKQREQTAADYTRAISQQDRNALQKGMQRSSYNQATLGNIAIAGNKALGDLGNNQLRQQNDIGSQRALLAQQLAQTLQQYDSSQQADILAYMDELEDKNYDRERSALEAQNSLASQIYQYQFQQEQAAQEQANWLAQFNKKSGGGGSGGKKATDPNAAGAQAATDAALSDLMAAFGTNPIKSSAAASQAAADYANAKALNAAATKAAGSTIAPFNNAASKFAYDVKNGTVKVK